MMKNALVAGSLICAGFAFQNSAWNPYARAELEPLDLDSIVQYASVNLNDNCSGVVIDEDHVLTAGHCVKGHPKDEKLKVHVNGMVLWAYWVRYEDEVDLAILSVPHANFKHPIKIATTEPTVGSDIYCVGNPFGVMPDTLTKGAISNKHRKSAFSKETRWQYDCTIHGGNSGGMVLNSAGELVAISTEGLIGPSQAGTSYAFGVPLEAIKKFLAPHVECILFTEAQFRAVHSHLQATYYTITGAPFEKLLKALNEVRTVPWEFQADYALIGVWKRPMLGTGGMTETMVGFVLFKDGCSVPGGKNSMLKEYWDAFLKKAGIEWADFAEAMA